MCVEYKAAVFPISLPEGLNRSVHKNVAGFPPGLRDHRSVLETLLLYLNHCQHTDVPP